MQLSWFVSSALALMVFSGCVDGGEKDEAGTTGPPPPPPPPPTVTFGAPVMVDPDMGGGEPSLIVDHEGRIFVAAPTGLLTPVTSVSPQDLRGSGQFWRSLDGGRTFEHIPNLAAGLYGPSVGGGDSDITVDGGGFLYAIDLWLGNNGFLKSTDHGDTWTQGSPYTFVTPGVDRQWIDVQRDGSAIYIAVNSASTGLWVIKSVDGGLTWPQQTLAVQHGDRGGCICPPGVLITSEADGDVHLPFFVAGGGVGIASSQDGGATFTIQIPEGLAAAAPGYPNNKDNFPVLADDAAGNLYLVAGGAKGVLISQSTDRGVTWSDAELVSPGEGREQWFPWIVAGSAGRVAVSWYEVQNGDWNVHVAVTHHYGAGWDVQKITQEPLLNGAYSRDVLGDFFEVAMGPDGSVQVVFNALPAGAARGVILHARQIGGEGLLEGVPVQEFGPTPPA